MNGETWKGFQREDIVPSCNEAIHPFPCTISRLYHRAFVLVRREQMTKISSCARVSVFGFYQPVRCLTLDPLSWIFGKQWDNLARDGTGGPSNENRSNRAFPCCCLATPRNHARPPSERSFSHRVSRFLQSSRLAQASWNRLYTRNVAGSGTIIGNNDATI